MQSPFPSPLVYHKTAIGSNMEILHDILDILQTLCLIALAWMYYKRYREDRE